MPFFDHQNAQIYYETWGEGSGPWITLLNGVSRTTTDFRAMARFLNERNWRVLLVDHRGAGKTESPLGFTLDDSAHDVVSLWDHLAITSSCLLGISYGGLVALHVALRVGGRVAKLVLVSTTCRSDQVLPPKDGDKTHYFSRGFIQRHRLMVPALLKEMDRAFRDPEKTGKTAAQRKAIEQVNVCGRLSKLHVPTLIIHGDEDEIVPVNAGRELHAAIAKSQIQIFTGAGHLLLAENPKLLYETLWEFCVTDSE